MRRAGLVVVALIVGLAASAAAQSPEPQDLEGVYVCQGSNPDGSAYQGIVEIVKDHDLFHVRWLFPESGTQAIGVGIQRDDVLAVSYFAGAPALAVYKIEKNTDDGDSPKLTGKWTVEGAEGAVFSETLTRAHVHIVEPDREPQPHERPASVSTPGSVSL